MRVESQRHGLEHEALARALEGIWTMAQEGDPAGAVEMLKDQREPPLLFLNTHPAELELPEKGIATVMVMGLQGSGKTTFCGKLATRMVKEGRKPMLVAADIYRPAAIDQLHVIGEQVGVPVHSDRERKNAAQIVKLGLRKAKDNKCDLLIVDTAGRLHIDDTLMGELESIEKTVSMDEKLLVLDAMTGQEAVNIAQGFDDALELTGKAEITVLALRARPHGPADPFLFLSRERHDFFFDSLDEASQFGKLSLEAFDFGS